MPASQNMSMRKWLYAAINLAFVAGVAVLAGSSSAGNPRVLYLIALMAICSLPILLTDRLNGPYASFSLFLALYFLFFGALDVVSLGAPHPATISTGIISTAELVVLAGGILFVLGYRTALRAYQRSPGTMLRASWPMASLVTISLLLWAMGTAAAWYWNIHLVVMGGDFQNHLGQAATLGLLVGRLLQPLGILILAYAQVTSRSRILLLLVIAIALFQVGFGFVSNTKSGAMLGGILVIVTNVLVTGRLPKAWLAAGLLFLIFGFPVFQAYRATVVDERGMTNAQAAEHLSEVLKIALENKERVSKDFGGAEYHSNSFVERSSLKSSVEMIVAGVGSQVPYQNGYTLIPLLTSLVPRVIWPTKLDVQAGQLLNRQFHVSGDDQTYISPSHLGELYWNFGWPGVVIGMWLLGMLLGFINGACDLSQYQSITRLLILATTIQQLCVRFEGSIATEYALWIRSILIILLLHLLLSRIRAGRPGIDSADAESGSASEHRPANAFPNLMR